MLSNAPVYPRTMVVVLLNAYFTDIAVMHPRLHWDFALRTNWEFVDQIFILHGFRARRLDE